ncbi:MAG: hypothetical protein ACFFCQ_01330 [Promethearchaeota archaeon]
MTKATNVQSWFSLATGTGLSVVSFGVPGIKTEIDEQVYTGGLTAVQSLLVTEIGVEASDAFMGGGDTSRMGRFAIRETVKGETRELVAQFLLASKDGRKLPSDLVELSQRIIIEFGRRIIKTDLWADVEWNLQQIPLEKVSQDFLDIITEIRKKTRVDTSLEPYKEMLRKSINSAFSNFDFSPTLVKISREKDIEAKVKEKYNDYLKNFSKEIVVAILGENPVPILLHPKPQEKQVLQTTLEFLKQTFNEFQQEVGLTWIEKMLDDFVERDAEKFLDQYSLANLRMVKEDLILTLQNALLKKFGARCPLLFLLYPNFNKNHPFVKNAVNTVLDTILQLYDIGTAFEELVSQITTLSKKEQLFYGINIRSFCNRFPRGLNNYGWIFLRRFLERLLFEDSDKAKEKILFDFIQKSDLNVNDPRLTQQIFEKVKEVKLTPQENITFDVRHGSEIRIFYNALRGAIIDTIDTITKTAFWGDEGMGYIPLELIYLLERLGKQTFIARVVINFLERLDKHSWRGFDPKKGLVNLEMIKTNDKPLTLDSILQIWRRPNLIIEKSCKIQESLLLSETEDLNKVILQITKEDKVLEKLQSEADFSKYKKLVNTKLKKPLAILEKNKLLHFSEIQQKLQTETKSILEAITKELNDLQSSKDPKNEKKIKKIQQSGLKRIKKHQEYCQRFEKEIKKYTEDKKLKIRADIKNPPKNLQDIFKKADSRPFISYWNKKEENREFPERDKVIDSISLRVEQTQLDRLVGLSEVSKARVFSIFEVLAPSIADLAIFILITDPKTSKIVQNAANLAVTKGQTFHREVYKQVEEYSKKLLSIIISQPLREIFLIFLLEDISVHTFQGESCMRVGKAPTYFLNSNQSMEKLFGFPVLQQPLRDQKGWTQIFIPLHIHPPPELEIQSLSQAIREILISSFRRELSGIIEFLCETGEMFSKYTSENILNYFDEVTAALLF